MSWVRSGGGGAWQWGFENVGEFGGGPAVAANRWGGGVGFGNAGELVGGPRASGAPGVGLWTAVFEGYCGVDNGRQSSLFLKFLIALLLYCCHLLQLLLLPQWCSLVGDLYSHSCV